MRFLAVLLSLFLAIGAFAQGEGGYTAPPMTAFSQGLLTNVNAAGWTNALGVGGAGISTPVSIANGGTGSATGNGSGLTNISLQDGGLGDEWGSATAMNNTLTQGPTIDSMGNSISWSLGGDNAAIYIGHSTNFVNNGGYGCSVTGYGTSGASVLGRTQGPTFSYISTNETDGFINAAGEIVFNASTIDRVFTICSPSGGTASAQDTFNYADGFMLDTEHSLLRVPLTPTLFTNGGCNQPDSVMWDFTCTAPTTAPLFYNDGYVDSNGKVFTAYTNNAAKTHLFLVSSSSGNPAASGTLTRISVPGTGDASITYSSVVANRGYIGDAFTANWVTGNVGVSSNVVITNGHLQILKGSTNSNGLNIFGGINNQGAALTFGTANNPQGLGEQQSRGIFTFQMGTGNAPFFAAIAPNVPANNGWFPSANMGQATFGGLELGDANNFGNSDLGVDGSFGSMITNYVANRTLTVDDSTALMNGNGLISATLPDATSHCKYRIYQIKNISATNSTILTTSSQTIDGKTGYTNAPNGSVTVQCDGANWQIIDKYLGSPTNTAVGASTGITNTWNWPATAYVSGTAIVYTNFNNAGNPVLTNTTLVNDTQAIHLQTGGTIKAASGLTIAMVANGN